MADPFFFSARPITPGTPVLPGTGVVIACSVEGYVRLVMSDGTFLDTYCYPGTSELKGYAVKGVDAASTTATARVTVVN